MVTDAILSNSDACCNTLSDLALSYEYMDSNCCELIVNAMKMLSLMLSLFAKAHVYARTSDNFQRGRISSSYLKDDVLIEGLRLCTIRFE